MLTDGQLADLMKYVADARNVRLKSVYLAAELHFQCYGGTLQDFLIESANRISVEQRSWALVQVGIGAGK